MSKYFTIKSNCSYLFAQYVSPAQYAVASLILLAVVIVIFYRYYSMSAYRRIGLTMTAVGSFFVAGERIIYGCVLDYFNFFGLFYFNTYDILISLGSAIMIFTVVFGRMRGILKS